MAITRKSLPVLILACLVLLTAGAHASTVLFTAHLVGTNEVPPNASPGIGSGTFTLDTVADTLQVSLTFSGLLAPSTAAHIHLAPPGVNGAVIIPFTGFPSGVLSGSYSNTFVLTPTLVNDLLNADTYVNVHSTLFPGGEIRDQLHPVPEPATVSLMAAAGLGLLRRKKKA